MSCVQFAIAPVHGYKLFDYQVGFRRCYNTERGWLFNTDDILQNKRYMRICKMDVTPTVTLLDGLKRVHDEESLQFVSARVGALFEVYAGLRSATQRNFWQFKLINLKYEESPKKSPM